MAENTVFRVDEQNDGDTYGLNLSFVLVVDDEMQIVQLLEGLLRNRGYTTLIARNGEDAFELYIRHRPPIVLADIKMPGMNGIELLRQVKELDGDRVEVIMISGHMDVDDAIESLRYGASRYLKKPIAARELLVSLKESSDKLRIVNEREKILEALESKVSEQTMEIEKTCSTVSEQRDCLQPLIDGIAEPITVIDRDYNIIFSNKASLEFMHGGVVEPGAKCYRLFHRREIPCCEEPRGDWLCPFEEIVRTKQTVVCTHSHVRKDGSVCQMEMVVSPVFDEEGEVVQLIETGRDVTTRLRLEEERKRLDERLFQEQKEQSIATLAGGIAHDFNNILMGVLGNAEFLQMKLPPGSERKLAEGIISSAERMGELTRQMLDYARAGKYQPRNISMNTIIQETLNMLQPRMPYGIDVVSGLSENLFPVTADTRQMTQVLINLLFNSFEAMTETGGRLVVRTENIVGKLAWECPHRYEHPGGDYVHIRVSDTGPGISEEVRKKIFEPFYTTKFMGRGLGLAAVFGIIRKHSGCITVESVPGNGATFHIYLPRACDEPVRPVKEETISPGPEREVTANILVVDDEPAILNLLDRVLTKMGHKVFTASDGFQAMEILKRKKNTVHMAILDVKMPLMDGTRLFSELKTLKPDLRVIISSGCSEAAAIERIPVSPDGFIQKPYRIAALREKLREVMKGP